MEQEKNAYVLGTDKEEMYRLGLQHQVWSGEARKGWKIAEFGPGQTILDLGSGPGFCSTELAYIVGKRGKVVAVDKSKVYTDYLKHQADIQGLNIEVINSDFSDMKFKTQLDGVYCRWALAWVDNPGEVIQEIADAMVSGGVFVAHEYFDWSTLQTEPYKENLATAIKTILDTFRSPPGNIDIGRHLPALFYQAGLEVISTRPMSKIGMPDDLTWEWPSSFFRIFFAKLVEAGTLDAEVHRKAIEELDELEYTEGACIFTPQMVEVIAVKP